MKNLISGLLHFKNHVFDDQRELFERLAAGQRPEAMLITCSDSRIVPNLLTQTGPGDLFIVRNPGAIVPPHAAGPTGEAAAIELALGQLGVRDIIVCGHSRCGAMSALVSDAALASMPAVAGWLAHAAEARTRVRALEHVDDEARVDAAARHNVLLQLEHLRSHPSVQRALAARTVRLHAWMYRIAEGEVLAHDEASGRFSPIEWAPPPTATEAR
jgi:carbonic anhydrase